MEVEKSLTNIAVAVPGSLGIILAVATFVFMVWLVRFVFRENAKREERLAGIIERDLVAQKAQLDRIETANSMQREEHRVILSSQEKTIAGINSLALTLERITGFITGNKKPDSISV